MQMEKNFLLIVLSQGFWNLLYNICYIYNIVRGSHEFIECYKQQWLLINFRTLKWNNEYLLIFVAIVIC